MGFPVIVYNPANAAAVEAQALRRMVRPLTRAENTRARTINDQVDALEAEKENSSDAWALANTSIANNLPLDPATGPPGGGPIFFSGLAFQQYFTDRSTIHDATIFYLRMLCNYLNARMSRGDSGSNPPNVPFVSIARRLVGRVDGMGTTLGHKLRVDKVSKNLTRDFLSHVPDPGDPMSSQFFSTQHIFLPCNVNFMWYTTGSNVLTPFPHVGLAVITPRARTVEYLDSLSAIAPRPEVVGNMLRLLSYHLGRDFIPSQWRMREGVSAQQRANEEWCSQICQTNALAIAMGYDVRSLHGMNWRARRRRTAMEMLQEIFSEDPRSNMYYGSTGTTPRNRAEDGFIPLTDQVMRWLDFPARARTGLYDTMSLAELDTHCAHVNAQDIAGGLPRGRYEGFVINAGQGLFEYISLLEQADWRFENPGQPTEPERTPDLSPPTGTNTKAGQEINSCVVR